MRLQLHLIIYIAAFPYNDIMMENNFGVYKLPFVRLMIGADECCGINLSNFQFSELLRKGKL